MQEEGDKTVTDLLEANGIKKRATVGPMLFNRWKKSHVTDVILN